MAEQPPRATIRDQADGPPLGQWEAAYQRLKREIEDGTYAPRQRLVEIDVAQTLGISRATMRAVLLRLQQDGLVELQPNRGARVRAFSLDEAVRIFQVREVLEGLAAALAAARITPPRLAALYDVHAAMERAWRADDPLRFSALNRDFHRAILTIAGHDYVERILGTLDYPLVRYRLRTLLVPGRKEASLEEHLGILRAFEQRAAAAAERAMRAHVAAVRTTLELNSHLPGYGA